MSELELPISNNEEYQQEPFISYFGYELIRDVLLPEIIGKNGPEILYWAGKRLARQYPLKTIDEVVDFFTQANWGTLTIKEEKRKELVFKLSGKMVATRLCKDKNSTYQLEAGFLAQQLESQKQAVAETFEHPHKRVDSILFTVKWDSKDPILEK